MDNNTLDINPAGADASVTKANQITAAITEALTDLNTSTQRCTAGEAMCGDSAGAGSDSGLDINRVAGGLNETNTLLTAAVSKNNGDLIGFDGSVGKGKMTI